jgi:hypothetical protein
MDKRRPRFPSLSAAVREGIRLVPHEAPRGRFFGDSPQTGRLGCDAVASAWFAEFFDEGSAESADVGVRAFLASPIADVYPVLRSRVGLGCPIGAVSCPTSRIGETVEAKIIHLEDEHGFTREQVAQWLEDRGF